MMAKVLRRCACFRVSEIILYVCLPGRRAFDEIVKVEEVSSFTIDCQY
jgi:hypothetical protein